MYLPINKKRGSAVEISIISGEWLGDNFAEYGPVGFDIIIKLLVTIHLLAFGIRDNHLAICLLNVQFVYFWSH